MPSRVTADEINTFYAGQFLSSAARDLITDVDEGYARLRRAVTDTDLRPGGYIAGPVQMSVADSVAYAAVFTLTGILPMAVTSSLNMSFLRPCIGEAVIAEARVMKRGRTLIVIDVDVKAEGAEKASGHAIVTYALPQN